MISALSVNDLLDHTDWERKQWLEWLEPRGNEVLAIGAGTGGDGRFEKVGDLIRHIFSAEKRYVDRLSGRPVTDTSSIPSGDLDALKRLGEQSRRELREFVATLPAERWDALEEMKFPSATIRATTRKIVVHILMHEIRHWAQIATLVRLSGQKVDFHDFLFSPVLGGEVRRTAQQA